MIFTILIWTLPAILLLRMIEILRVRVVTQRASQQICSLNDKIGILIHNRDLEIEDTGVDYVINCIDNFKGELDTLTIWSILYNNVSYKKKLKELDKIEEFEVIKLELNALVNRNENLKQIHDSFLQIVSHYVMTKSCVVVYVWRISKALKYITKAVQKSKSFRPLQEINKTINQDLSNEFIFGYRYSM